MTAKPRILIILGQGAPAPDSVFAGGDMYDLVMVRLRETSGAAAAGVGETRGGLRETVRRATVRLLLGSVGIASAIEADWRMGRRQVAGRYFWLVHCVRIAKWPLKFLRKVASAPGTAPSFPRNPDRAYVFGSKESSWDGYKGVVLIATCVGDLRMARNFNVTDRRLAGLPWQVVCSLAPEVPKTRLYLDAFTDTCRSKPLLMTVEPDPDRLRLAMYKATDAAIVGQDRPSAGAPKIANNTVE